MARKMIAGIPLIDTDNLPTTVKADSPSNGGIEVVQNLPTKTTKRKLTQYDYDVPRIYITGTYSEQQAIGAALSEFLGVDINDYSAIDKISIEDLSGKIYYFLNKTRAKTFIILYDTFDLITGWYYLDILKSAIDAYNFNLVFQSPFYESLDFIYDRKYTGYQYDGFDHRGDPTYHSILVDFSSLKKFIFSNKPSVVYDHYTQNRFRADIPLYYNDMVTLLKTVS